jgi:hypothetical protein
MIEVQTSASSALFGGHGHTSVSRGLGEFQARRPVLITSTGETVLALPSRASTASGFLNSWRFVNRLCRDSSLRNGAHSRWASTRRRQ